MSIGVNVVPLRRITAVLGLKGVRPSDQTSSTIDSSLAADVSAAVARVACRTPWTSTCMARALTAARLTSVRGGAVTVTLGVRRDKSGGVDAHAWAQHGKLALTGVEAADGYQPVGCFAR